MSAQANDVLAVSYAALILQDEGMPVSAASMDKLVAAAGCKAPGYYACMVEKALESCDLADLIKKSSTRMPLPRAHYHTRADIALCCSL